MDVQIQWRKLIKPSKPTPQHLQIFKLSLFDELSPPVYINILFHYLPTTEHLKSHKAETLNRLEESLSETLIDFYPLTGRFDQENLVVHCKDQGVEYFEAKVNSDLSTFLEAGSKVYLVEEFLPKLAVSTFDSPLLSIQINLFDCGGIVFGFRVFHQVVDACSIISFIKTWARRCKEEEKDSTFDFIASTQHVASLFPATKNFHHESGLFSNRTSKIVIKRLVFSGEQIAELKSRFREKYGSCFDDNKQPSRVTIVTAIIWKALISICSTKNAFLKHSFLAPAMNLRRRMVNLSISDDTYGNFWMPYMARFEPKNMNTVELYDVVHQLVDATREAGNSVKGNIDSISSAITNSFKEVYELLGRRELNVFAYTSWCGFNMYGADFGWGNPGWVSCSGRSVNMLTLLDTECGKGIEAWVPLNEEDIDLFRFDPEIAELVA